VSQRKGQWPQAFTEQDGDRIRVVHPDGVFDTTDLSMVEPPDWDGQSHIWFTNVMHYDANPWDDKRTLGAETLLSVNTKCSICGVLWFEGVELRCTPDEEGP